MTSRKAIRHILSLLLVFAVTFTFTFTFAVSDSFAASKSKKKTYNLPKSIICDYKADEEDYLQSVTGIKYDKQGNLTYGLVGEMIPYKYIITYKNKKKGIISKVTFGDGEVKATKYFDKKGRIKKTVYGKKTYAYKTDKKGRIKKVTLNGKTVYSVKSMKFYKNGMASKVTYSNGNVTNYNSDGLLTSETVKKQNGTKDTYTYKYTKNGGKVILITVYRNGSEYMRFSVTYGNNTTTDVWKYSNVFSFANGPSYAGEIYSKCALSGFNALY